MFSIADNLKNVSQRIQKATIAAGRSEDSVFLLPVTKARDANTLYDLIHLGVFSFGENYLNEALDKQRQLKERLTPDQFEATEWHFIGPIQSNKTKAIAGHFDWVQSIDRSKIARRLSEQRPADFPPLNVCIQVNINDEESKSGVALEKVADLAEVITHCPNLRLRGLMAIPMVSQGDAQLREAFLKMSAAFRQLAERVNTVDTLSMGMSGDIEPAIECGATMVRVGTALFGGRMK